jgi:pantoate--beta-alanine ligase
MLEASSRSQLQAALTPYKRAGKRVALVPTMGNLHQGHLSLVQLASQHADVVVTSIFVNPTQFGPNEDFASYPRTLAADREALRNSQCSVLFTPTTADLYPFGSDCAVMLKAPTALTNCLCGASRPGHFDGVLSVVARLLLISQAEIAVFGEKDYQQLLLIERMCADLGFATRILLGPTQREDSGLAISSRNQYLQPTELARAAALHASLNQLQQQIRAGNHDYDALRQAAIKHLQAQQIEVEYLQIVNATTLQTASNNDRQLRILIAARLPGARLIDNIGVEL